MKINWNKKYYQAIILITFMFVISGCDSKKRTVDRSESTTEINENDSENSIEDTNEMIYDNVKSLIKTGYYEDAFSELKKTGKNSEEIQNMLILLNNIIEDEWQGEYRIDKIQKVSLDGQIYDVGIYNDNYEDLFVIPYINLESNEIRYEIKNPIIGYKTYSVVNVSAQGDGSLCLTYYDNDIKITKENDVVTVIEYGSLEKRVSTYICSTQDVSYYQHELAMNNFESDESTHAEDNREYVTQKKANKKQEFEPYIGMPIEDADKTIWGKSYAQNELVTQYGTHVQYCYSNNRYIYFDSGYCTSYSFSK